MPKRPNIRVENDPLKRRRCQATVYERDTYRRTGRGKTGFEMHYRPRQCTRAAKIDGFCAQHKAAGSIKLRWADEFMPAPSPSPEGTR